MPPNCLSKHTIFIRLQRAAEIGFSPKHLLHFCKVQCTDPIIRVNLLQLHRKVIVVENVMVILNTDTLVAKFVEMVVNYLKQINVLLAEHTCSLEKNWIIYSNAYLEIVSSSNVVLENQCHLITHPFLCVLNDFFIWSFLPEFHIKFEIDISLQDISR